MNRFTGSVEYLCEIPGVQPVVEWITAIPFEDWPQQTRLEDGGIRPAMVKDLDWNGFGGRVASHVAEAMQAFPGCTSANAMLTVVMPGHDISPHVDQQRPEWLCRVHIPLTTTDESRFMVAGESHHMEVGKAYIVNTEVIHAVENRGSEPRIHLMFDVLAQA